MPHIISSYRNRRSLSGLRVALALVLAAVLALVAMPNQQLPRALADTSLINFETYTPGTVNGQDGWSSTGAAGSGCAIYDHAVAANTYGYTSFGTQSLRISNAVTSGCFNDHTFSKSLVDEAGETAATSDGLSGGTRQTSFEAQWDFASTVPGAEQPGLSVVASPDRGDGARMSWVQMTDTPTGLAVNFNDYQKSVADFVLTNVASGLDRTTVHTLKITLILADGVANDVVQIFVDGVLRHTGTSWEDYFRDVELNPTHTVDSILFRTGGVAAPATAGKGFLIDNLTISSGAVPSSLAFSAQPGGAAARGVLNPQPVVTVKDADGNTATTYNGPVTIAIAGNPGGGTLSGTTSVNAVNGVAAFAGLSIDKPGAGYTLVAAAAGLSGSTSTAFAILSGPATQLAFSTQPGSAAANGALNPQPVVIVKDADGNTATTYNGPVTIAIGGNPGGGTLSGITTLNAVNGVATFAGLSIDKAGAGYTLVAAAAGLSGSTSTAFAIIAAAQLQFSLYLPSIHK